MRTGDKGAVASWSFAELIKDVQVPEKHLGTLRAKQLETVGKMTIVMVLANLLNAAVVMLSFRQTAVDNLLIIWGFTITFICGLSFLTHVRTRNETNVRQRSQRDIENYARSASINGLVWAIAPIIVVNVVDAQGQMVMGIVMAGMMFAGAFLLSRVPDAAFSFIVPVGLGLLISMQFQQDAQYQFVSILTIAYLGILMLAVRWSHRQLVEQHLNEAAVSEQSQLIGLLLRDFEESTSDWLWQTSAHGVLEDIPLVLDQQLEPASFMEKGGQLSAMFIESEARRVLETSLARRTGFRDLVLQVKTDGAERWWSVTGKPIFENETFKGFRGVAADVTQSKEIEDRIAFMAHYDGLTGLPNRMTMQEHLERAVRKPLVAHTDRALVWLDLDNFKWVNDTLGHPAGDELLRQVAGRITRLSNESDSVARLGGDEFAMIVERASDGGLEAFLDQLSAHLREPYEIWGSTANCSASIGVRLFDPYTSDTRMLLKHADLALYQAKKLGKSKWCMFTSELDERARARLLIESELQKAMDQNELRVFFQPLVDAKTHTMVGCETLLRWQHPKRGLVFPGEFIEHAEDNGLITRMGDWVIRAALAEAARLPDHMRISINISPLQIHSASLVSTIVNAVASNDIDPSRVELEITETVLMSDTEFTLKRLHQLKSLGIRIALDDFGTGYSSLSYLRSFPFDKIKIDKSFVKDIETRADSRAITIATLNLAKSLGMRCTAEGVETLYQADFLRDHGCDELQGFFISRAQPLNNLAHLVELKSVEEHLVPSANKPAPALSLVPPEGRAAKAG